MNGIILEDSEGGRQGNPTESQIRATIERIGDSLDHCILHLPGGEFVQTAGDRDRLLIQYSDAGEIVESAGAEFDAAQVTRIFMAAVSGNDEWKQEFVSRKTGGGGEAETPGTAETAGTESSGGSLKEQLFGSVKRELNREASRGLGNLVRKGIRTFSGRR